LGILGGPSWTGKTTLALAACAAAVQSNGKVGALYYTFDMDKVRLMKRLLSSASDVPFARLAAPDKDKAEQQAVEQGLAHLREHVFPHMKFVGRRGLPRNKPLTAEGIEEACDELREASGAERVLVVVDYLRLMPVPSDLNSDIDRDHYRLNQLHQFQQASRSLKEPEGHVVLVLSEVRKDRADGGSLTLEDLIGSARVGYSADLVLLLNRLDRRPGTPGTTRLNLEIAKGRDGVEWASLDLLFHYAVSRFAEADGVQDKKKIATTKQPHGNGQKSGRLTGL
jgi:replicative DNA helicase